MNIARNMEAIFLIAALSAATAVVAMPAPRSAPQAAARHDGNMSVVTVVAKRLTPEQKAALGS